MRRLEDGTPRRHITLDLEGHPVPAREGESAAAALLAAGETVFSRSVKYHRPRAPYCMSGACSHCLMRVDGVPNVFTCCVPARPGMRLERQNAYPSVEHDVFGAIDWIFPHGLDHHEMFAGVPVAEQVMAKVARHLAGLGLLPDKVAPQRQPTEILHVRALVVGGGAAGLAAARELQSAKVPFLLIERETSLGGRLAWGAPGRNDPPLSTFEQLEPGQLRLGTLAIGLFDDEAGRFVAAVSFSPGQGPRLLKVYADRFLFATGGYPMMWAFANNDSPGVFSGRAVAKLIRRDRLLPGERFALVGTGPELYDLARLVTSKGGEVVLVLDVAADPPKDAPPGAQRGEPLKALGRTKVKGLTWSDRSGHKQKIACDAIAVCVPVSPAFELARQAGAQVVFSEAHQGFVVKADPEGRTEAEHIYVAGDLLGEGTAAQAAESGARAAKALVGGLR